MEEEINVQMENNPSSTAERTLRPITYISWLLGVGIARPKGSPKWLTIFIRVLHFAVCTVFVAYSAMDFANFGKEFTSKLFEIMYCMNETVCHLAAYYYVCHIMRHYDKWPELMRMFESLDRNISREFTMKDRCVKIRQIFAIIIVSLFGPVSLIVHVLYYYFTNFDQIYASDLLLYYTIAQTLVNSFVFDIVVYMICQRFRAINVIIARLDERLGTYWTTLKIRRIRRLYNEICSMVMTMNDIYGVDLLLCSTNAFIMVVAKLFRIYMSAAEHKNSFIFLNNVIWLIYGCQFVMMCWVCTLTHREINKIGLHISEFVLNTQHTTKFNKLAFFRNFRNKEPEPLDICNYTRDNNAMLNGFGMESLLRTNIERDCVRNEINDFSLQLQHHRIMFTACDFFEIDNSLLTRFISVITTYLIILVQFYKPDSFQA
ncbi:Putative gustatory receptor 2a [Anthophora plagiata]